MTSECLQAAVLSNFGTLVALVIMHRLHRAITRKTAAEAFQKGRAEGYATGHLEGRVEGIRETKP